MLIEKGSQNWAQRGAPGWQAIIGGETLTRHRRKCS